MKPVQPSKPRPKKRTRHAKRAVVGGAVPQNASDLRRVAEIVSRPASNVQDPASADAYAALGASAFLREDELRQFLEMSRDMMCAAHTDGGLIRFNPAFAATLGYSRQGLIGRLFLDFVDPADRAYVQATLADLCNAPLVRGATAPTVYMDCRMNDVHGATRWTRWTIRKGGQVLYCLGRDITEYVKHEEAMRYREQQLSEAQALAHMGHWRWEVGASDIVFSTELYNIFGVDRRAFVPTMESINALVHRRDLGRLYQAFQRAIIQRNDYEMDFRVMRPDGAVRVVRCEGRCEKDADGEVVALYGIMQDVTG